jgi:hypothetical protein
LVKLSSHDRFGLAARVATLIGVVVLICVPALTRVGQRLDTSSRAPSFRNVDCPPKKAMAAPAQAILTATAIGLVESAPVVRRVPPAVPAPQRTLFLAVPRPLRAPPPAHLS